MSVQNVSKLFDTLDADLASVEQADRVFRCRPTQVHVALRRREVRVAGQLLDGPCRGSLHPQVRTERVPKDVHALVDSRNALSAAHGFDNAIACHR